MIELSKKNFHEVSDIEKDQLRFLFEYVDINELLETLNPSLSWIPFFLELKRKKPALNLESWISNNFEDYNSLATVVDNLQFFTNDSAKPLAKYLEENSNLSRGIKECWHFIIKCLDQLPADPFKREQFDVERLLRKNISSPELIQRVVSLLKPEIVLSNLYQPLSVQIEHTKLASQLMNIDFKCNEVFARGEPLNNWIKNIDSIYAVKFLNQLITALKVVLDDAIRAGIEFKDRLGKSDLTVRSIAKHNQDKFYRGFYPIVRTIIDTWDEIEASDNDCAVKIANDWGKSKYHLIRRFGLYAAKKQRVSIDIAFDLLNSISIQELFLTSSSVELYQLITTKWNEFSDKQKLELEKRFVQGFPKNLFRENQNGAVDRCRFDLLGHMRREKLKLSKSMETTLKKIEKKYPNWKLRPREQAGFFSWSETTIGGPYSEDSQNNSNENFKGDSKSALNFTQNEWLEYCKHNPYEAVIKLKHTTKIYGWNFDIWSGFFRSYPENHTSEIIELVAKYLVKCPDDIFKKLSHDISYWIQFSSAFLLESINFWGLWDRIAVSLPNEIEFQEDLDLHFQSLNNTFGNLADSLVTVLDSCFRENKSIPDELIKRFTGLLNKPGSNGRLARIRLVTHLYLLFEALPEWTKKNFIKLFDLKRSESKWMWRALPNIRIFGPPELFGLLKEGLKKYLAQKNLDSETIKKFVKILVLISLFNQENTQKYPISNIEIRQILRVVGSKYLDTVALELGRFLRKVDENDRSAKWLDIVGPVFSEIWPLDQDLKTPTTNESLVELIRLSENSFSDAGVKVMPFLVPDDKYSELALFDIKDTKLNFYQQSPELILQIVSKLIGETPNSYYYTLVDAILKKINNENPQQAKTKIYQKLARSIESPRV